MILAFDRSRYPEDYLRRGYSEANVQLVVLARLRQRGCWVHVVDAGAAQLRGRVRGALARAKTTVALGAITGATGVTKGITDLVGVAPDGRALFVEVKAPEWLGVSPATGALIQRRPAGKPTDEQVAFLLEAERRGAVAGIAWAGLDVDGILGRARRAA